jgi:uncharacterized membrane protein
LTQAALFTALVTAVTMAVNVPVPATQGIINVGDSMIFTAALLVGPRIGLFAGGVGSALANLLLGISVWAPWTLVIKGLEGFIVGSLGHRAFRASGKITPAVLASVIVGGLWMVFGYFLAGSFLFGYRAALVEFPGNLLQAGGSALIAIPLVHALRRVELLS